MPCDTFLKQNQTISQRATEVRTVVSRVEKMIATNTVKVKVGPTGGIVFDGISNEDRDGVTDACIYRRVMATGSALAKHMIAKAEQLAGRPVNRQALAAGHHSHDGGQTWHHGH